MRKFLAAALLLLSACAHREKNFFPIGLFAVHDPAALAMLRQEGFNAIQAYPHEPEKLEALAKEAQRQDMRLLAHPHSLVESGKPPPRWPMAAWYLRDEPDVFKEPAKSLADFEAKVKAWDPATPTTFVVGDGRAAPTYGHIADILMVDWYPVPHLQLSSVGDHVRWTMEAGKGKPVWAVLQAFDWKWSRQRRPNKDRIGRFPTSAEIRFMSYLSLIEGARGLWYFAYAPGEGIILSERVELWILLTRVTRELAQLRPILADGTDLGKMPDLPAGMMGRTWKKGRRLYHALINTVETSKPLPARFTDRNQRPLFERRRWIKDLLKEENGALQVPYGRVLVFEETP